MGWSAKAYPSELICNAFLVAIAVHPGEHSPLLSTLSVVENEAGSEQHVIGELIALHLKALICELQTKPTKPGTCVHAASEAQQQPCNCVFSMQVCVQHADCCQHAGVFSACIALIQIMPLDIGWWHLQWWHVFQVCIVPAQILSLDLKLMAVSMMAVVHSMWYRSLRFKACDLCKQKQCEQCAKQLRDNSRAAICSLPNTARKQSWSGLTGY